MEIAKLQENARGTSGSVVGEARSSNTGKADHMFFRAEKQSVLLLALV